MMITNSINYVGLIIFERNFENQFFNASQSSRTIQNFLRESIFFRKFSLKNKNLLIHKKNERKSF